MKSHEAHESRAALRLRAASTLLLGAALMAIFLVIGYFGFVGTTGGQWWDNAGYAGRQVVGARMEAFDSQILGEVSQLSVMISLAVIFFLSLLFRCPLVGSVVVTAAAGAIFGAEFLKHTLPRELLSEPLVPVPAYFSGDTYPSGHTAIASSLALAIVVISGPFLRPWIAVLTGIVSTSYATGVLFVGWHRPSDALGGLAWSGFCFTLAAAVLAHMTGHHARPKNVTAWKLSAALATLMIGILGLAVFAKPGDLAVKIPFFSMSAAIIALGFALPAWLAFALRHISWHSHFRSRDEKN